MRVCGAQEILPCITEFSEDEDGKMLGAPVVLWLVLLSQESRRPAGEQPSCHMSVEAMGPKWSQPNAEAQD